MRRRTPRSTVTMTGTPLAQNAHASLALFEVDSAGNWPMKLSVSGLAPAKDGRPYELWLTRHGKARVALRQLRADERRHGVGADERAVQAHGVRRLGHRRGGLDAPLLTMA